MLFFIPFLVIFLSFAESQQKELNFVIYYQPDQQDIPFITEEIFKELNSHKDILRTYHPFNNKESLETFQTNLCSQLSPSAFNIILDLVWSKHPQIRHLATALEIPYFKIDPTIYPFLEPAVKFISARNGTESVFILPEKELIDQTIYGLMEHSKLRFMIFNGIVSETAQKLLNKRPIAQYNTIVARAEDMNRIFEQAILHNLIKFEDRWNLLFLDSDLRSFKYSDNFPGVTKIVVDNSFYCQWFPETRGKDCDWPEGPFDHLPVFLRSIYTSMINFYQSPSSSSSSSSYAPQIISLCDEPFNAYPSNTNFSTLRPELDFFDHLSTHPVLFADPHNQIKFKLDASIYKSTDSLETQLPANYSSFTGQISSSIKLQTTRRYFRIGTAFALPWSTYKLHPNTGEPLRTTTGQHIWEGYCIDFIKRLSEVMDFSYDLVEPTSRSMGEKIDGKFNGVVGDLVSGEIDIAVAALATTAEREEVIDFVAPIFEETGISIVIRKPIRATSLFKFMTVLKTEVWCSILVSLIMSAILIWLMDKYSPYSAQNRKYPFESRHFSLKESFWFTLTSYTPQGGGELPKSLSARTLVATYWLFVVLILATFTANLAAFLTVERMQTPVQSLEQLGKQSRINYTVVEGSETHQYFINMKFAEDLLYDTWKNISLASTDDQEKYRVWDYPIREQFGQILRFINSSMPVRDAREGFQNVIDHLNADYAFIHDAQEIKYEMTRNCDLTEIGEVFGKRPYGVAVQQGNSLLTDELTRAILQLQGERFFDQLKDKYWNATIGNCATEENEGMSLESLGGVFIVTLFGLGIAMIALIFEWIFYWRKARELANAEGMEEEGDVDGDITEDINQPRWLRSAKVGVRKGEAFNVVKKRSVVIVEDHPLD